MQSLGAALNYAAQITQTNNCNSAKEWRVQSDFIAIHAVQAY